LGGPIPTDEWCYLCECKTIHPVLQEHINFVGKLIKCTMCGETIDSQMARPAFLDERRNLSPSTTDGSLIISDGV